MDMLEPGRFGFAVNFKKRYGNFIGGQWVAPAKGEYFENVTPVTGRVFCEIPRSTAEDVERALDAAHAALAACAASRARSTSSALERGISQNTRPVMGVMFSKYSPLAGGTHSPPMKLP